MYLYQLTPTVRVSPKEVSSIELIPGKNDLWQNINNARYQSVWYTVKSKDVKL